LMQPIDHDAVRFAWLAVRCRRVKRILRERSGGIPDRGCVHSLSRVITGTRPAMTWWMEHPWR
jgi:hypothetical protein